jgi:hypothetical protein
MAKSEKKGSRIMTPTQRTMKALRERGDVMSAVAERWLQHVKRPDGGRGIRQDLLGWIDIVSLRHDAIVGVQSTGSDFAAHLDKLLHLRRDAVVAWLQAGGVAELWGWRKVKAVRGGKQMVWRPRVRVLTLEDYGLGGMFE